MPRSPRIAFEDAFFHVFNRGLNKEKIFLDDQDYRKFLTRLAILKGEQDYDFQLYAYILMPNHFHFLIQTHKTPISKIMTSLSTSYSMYFNNKYHRTGVLFQNRFKSILCEKDSYFLEASRYIHLNPIEAGLASNLADYPWSSYQELFGIPELSLMDSEAKTQLTGSSEKEKESYHKYLDEGLLKFEEMKKDYSFERSDHVKGRPLFNTLSQKKYLRRKNTLNQ